MHVSSASIFDRIMRQVTRREGGCWEWQGNLSRNGYGRISVRGTKRVVHRVMFALLGGYVADDEQLDHTCNNRACCNPEHLEPVRPTENYRRRDARAAADYYIAPEDF